MEAWSLGGKNGSMEFGWEKWMLGEREGKMDAWREGGKHGCKERGWETWMYGCMVDVWMGGYTFMLTFLVLVYVLYSNEKRYDLTVLKDRSWNVLARHPLQKRNVCFLMFACD